VTLPPGLGDVIEEMRKAPVSPGSTPGSVEEALELSVAARRPGGVALCLAAYAERAFVEGDHGRAAWLAGAADGVRRRAGLRVWPTLR
jgi:hypothetical protein